MVRDFRGFEFASGLKDEEDEAKALLHMLPILCGLEEGQEPVEP